jgi:hypothetical protein
MQTRICLFVAGLLLAAASSAQGQIISAKWGVTNTHMS